MAMDRKDYVHGRKRRYMAQVLDNFEARVAPHLPPEAAPVVDDFKGLVRARMNALAVDACAVMGDGVQNDAALELRAGLPD